MKQFKRILAGLTAAAVFTTSFTTAVYAKTTKETKVEYPKLNLSFAVNGTDTQIDTKVGQYLAELVSKKSGGNITIDVFPNDTLAGGNATKGIEYVCAGATDLAAYATSTLSAIDPKLNIATMPWTFADYDEAKEIINTTGGDYYEKRLANKKLTYLGAFHNGFRQLTNSKHSVKEPKDLKGLKIRIPGSKIYMEFWEAIGASPTAMSWSEVFTAIQQGTIDGHDNSLSTINSANVQEVQKYISISKHAYEAFTFMANAKKFDTLTPDTQQLIRDCVEEATKTMNQEIIANEETLVDKFTNENGCEIYTFTEDDMAAFKEVVQPLIDEYKGIYGAEACAAFGVE